MKRLKIGDRVKAINEVAGINLKERLGTIIDVKPTLPLPILVEFDKPFKWGHNGRGWGKQCKDKHGRWMQRQDLIHIEVKVKKKKV